MRIPAFLYGSYKQVKANCRKIITKLKRGRTWNEIFAEEEFLDTETTSGLIILDGPNPNFGSGDNFHLYVLHRELAISSVFGPHVSDYIYYSSLQSSWSLTAMVNQQLGNYFRRLEDRILFFHRERILAFWDAQLLFWDEIQDVGKRYCFASEGTAWACGLFFHSVANSIKAQGISMDSHLLDPMYCYRDTNILISSEKLGEFIEIAKRGIDLMCEKSYKRASK